MSYRMTKDKFLLPEELERLRKVLDLARSSSPRDVLMIELCLATGARASELLAIKRSDIGKDGFLMIRGLKGSNDREIPLKTDLRARLEAYANSIDTELLFPIKYRRFKQIWDSFCCDKKLHSTRHTFALQVMSKTKDLKLVQTALGHRSLKNTLVYLDFLSTKDEMRKIIA